MIAMILLVPALGACAGSWDAVVVGADGQPLAVDRGLLKSLVSPEEAEAKTVALEHVLWNAGHRVIDRVVVVDSQGTRHDIQWNAEVAEGAVWALDGALNVGELSLVPARVEVTPHPLANSAQVSITDVAPTAAAALGLAAPDRATGRVLAPGQAQHVLLLFLDGLGYERYVHAREQGVIPNLAALEEPRLGTSVYPPSTSVASAAVLTGAPPEVNGVAWRGIRITDAPTLFDVAAAAGRRVVAVEGNALAFNLRNAEMTLSGDRDGDGSTDDNVLRNALDVLAEGMPDLLWVHFHGIDDAGHTYGPGTEEETAALHAVDAAVGELLAALPAGTLTIIFADHGQHLVEEEGRLGNHGHLVSADMLIPVWVIAR